MRTGRGNEVLQLSAIVAMFVAGVATLPTAPTAVPIRWNGNGQVTGYTSPEVALLFLPTLALVAYLGLRLLPLIDPGRANYANFTVAYAALRWMIIALIVVGDGAVHLAIRGVLIDAGLVVPVTVGLMLLVAGNLVGKLRPNWFVGIATPWTLSSKRSWIRTHIVAGRVLVLVGVVFMLTPAARLIGLRSLAVMPFAVAFAVLCVIRRRLLVSGLAS